MYIYIYIYIYICIYIPAKLKRQNNKLDYLEEKNSISNKNHIQCKISSKYAPVESVQMKS